MKWNDKWKDFIGVYGLQQLTEADIPRILTKYMEDGFIVATSDRTCEAENGLAYGQVCTEEAAAAQELINQANYKDLIGMVRAAGFGYIPAFGGYKEKVIDKETGKETSVDTDKPENSIVIVARPQNGRDYEQLKALGVEITKKYNQDSFFYKPPDEIDRAAYYIDREGNVDDSAPVFTDFKPQDLSQEFYTQLKKGQQRRFTALPENIERVIYLREHPKSVWEARKRYGEIFIKIQ